MSRTLKLWLTTALALVAYVALVAALAGLLRRQGLGSDESRRWVKHGLWAIGALAAAAVLWFRRPAPTPKRPPDAFKL